MKACSAISSPRLSNRKRSYDDKLWSTYIAEAIQSGNATQYCINKNTPYRTYQQNLAEYNKIENKENWSPSSKRRYNHRVFTDSTEKAAVEQLTEQVISTSQQKLIDTLNDYNHKYVMNSGQTRIQQSMPPVYTIHPTDKPAVVELGVNTNPDISATCTVTADGGILPLYFIYPEGQIKHVTGNSVKQQSQFQQCHQ